MSNSYVIFFVCFVLFLIGIRFIHFNWIINKKNIIREILEICPNVCSFEHTVCKHMVDNKQKHKGTAKVAFFDDIQ